MNKFKIKTENLLVELNSFYEELSGNIPSPSKLYCKKGCTHCCTKDAGLVQFVESINIIKTINTYDAEIRQQIKSRFDKYDEAYYSRQIDRSGPPEVVFSEICKQHIAAINHLGHCPFLFDNLCIIYANRPYICRSFYSFRKFLIFKTECSYNLDRDIQDSFGSKLNSISSAAFDQIYRKIDGSKTTEKSIFLPQGTTSSIVFSDGKAYLMASSTKKGKLLIDL